MRTLIVTTRIVLDPDEVENAHDNGVTDGDIKREIKNHLNSAIGNRNIIDAGYIMESEILDVIEEE